ncbi:hypothetical protein KY385_04245 [Candidatus Parcubacteria bacterium]|nr:hypothetical protein [Candidatus Parcubacteria bacterium]
MQSTIKISLTSLLAFAAACAVALAIQSTPATAQGGEVIRPDNEVAQTEEKKEDNKEDKKEQNTGDSFTYKAQPGDTYSEMARKAVQTYGIENNVNLTPAGIVYAETLITNEANVGLLEVGQEVKISKDLVKKYVEEAEELSGKQQKAWGYYVQFVDFNTDKVGQE